MNENNSNWYIILFGALVLHLDELGALGVLTMEHTVGEESVVNSSPNKYDAAYAQKETYMLEIKSSCWQDIKETLFITGKRNEFLKLDRLLKHNFAQKELWRSRQHQSHKLSKIEATKIIFGNKKKSEEPPEKKKEVLNRPKSPKPIRRPKNMNSL